MYTVSGLSDSLIMGVIMILGVINVHSPVSIDTWNPGISLVLEQWRNAEIDPIEQLGWVTIGNAHLEVLSYLLVVTSYKFLDLLLRA